MSSLSLRGAWCARLGPAPGSQQGMRKARMTAPQQLRAAGRPAGLVPASQPLTMVAASAPPGGTVCDTKALGASARGSQQRGQHLQHHRHDPAQKPFHDPRLHRLIEYMMKDDCGACSHSRHVHGPPPVHPVLTPPTVPSGDPESPGRPPLKSHSTHCVGHSRPFLLSSASHGSVLGSPSFLIFFLY